MVDSTLGQIAERSLPYVRSGRLLSPGLLFAAFWMMTTFASFRSRELWELLGDNGFDAQVKFQVVSWCAFGLLAAFLILRGALDHRLLTGGPLACYAVFIVLAMVSTLYSPAPALTAFAALQLAVATVLVCCLGRRLDAIYPIIAIYVAINWILVLLGSVGIDFGQSWIAPAQDIYVQYGGGEWETWRLTSAFGHPSLISIVAAMAAVGLAARTRGSTWKRNGWLIGWLSLTVLLTVSRTAIVGMILGFVVVAWRRRTLIPTALAAAIAAVTVLSVPAVREPAIGYLMRGQSGEDFSSLTGRTDLYALALEDINILSLGHGFRAARADLVDDDSLALGASHAHNLVLEALISLGLPGAAAVIAGIVLLGFYAVVIARHPQLARHNRSDRACEALAVFFPILTFSILDSGFAMNANPFVMAFIAFAAKTRSDVLALRALGQSDAHYKQIEGLNARHDKRIQPRE